SLSYESFIKNEDYKKSFVRALEIIGEASKHLPAHIRKKYSQIQWKSVVGIRNKLIHEYFGVDYFVVWKTIKDKIPQLYEVIKEILRDINKHIP
ncbi:MAG: DUF86 domain-containing protein, partial [Endomicrobia bacterium]|nr:DUF86 domain-containing protein [Endomicrobiia bacterium]